MFHRPLTHAPRWILLLATLLAGPAAAAMTADGVLRFPDDGDAKQALCGAVIDAAHGFAYIGTDDAIVKLALPGFARVASLALDPADAPVGVVAGVIDPARGFAYFGTKGNGTVPAKLLKLDLARFQIVGSLVPTTAFPHNVGCTAIDPTHQYAYVSVGTHLYQVDLGTFQLTAAVATFAASEQPMSAVMDPAHGMLYVGGYSGTVMQYSAGAAGLSRLASVALASGEATGQALIDPQAGFACFVGGGNVFSKKVAQVRLSPFARVGGIDLSASLTGYPQAAAYDAANHQLYLGTGGSIPTAQVAKVGVGAGGLTNDGVLSTAVPGGFVSSVVDPAGGRLYLATGGDPVQVQRVDIGSRFAFSGLISFSIRVGGLRYGAADSAGGYTYFLTDSRVHPSTIAKVRTSDLTVGQELVLPPDATATCWVLDPAAGFLYVGTSGSISSTSTTPAEIFKVRCSDLALIDTLVLPAGDELVWKADADLARHVAYFINTSHTHIIEIGIDPARFSRIGSIPLPTGFVDAMVVDPGHRLAYVHQGSTVLEVDLAAGRATGRTAPLAQALVASFFDPLGAAPHFVGAAGVYQLAESGMTWRSVAAPAHETFTGGAADGGGMAYLGVRYSDGVTPAKGQVASLRCSDLALLETLTLATAATDSGDFHAVAVDPVHGKGFTGSDGGANGIVYRFATRAAASTTSTTTGASTTGTTSTAGATGTGAGGQPDGAQGSGSRCGFGATVALLALLAMTVARSRRAR
jgi:hypothetical protein